MAAVIRLKRHLSEEPIEALIINCKRQKRNNDDETEEKETKTLLKFAGTIKEQNEDITPHIKKINKIDVEQSYKKHVPDFNVKNRKEFKDKIKNSRLKVVNLSRSINDAESSSNKTDEQKLVTTVLDVETECKDDDKSSDSNFVYDLYYTTSDDLCDLDDKTDNEFRVLPIEQELVFEDYRDPDGVNDFDESSEDSNAENNWRNDYPDEDEDMDSIDEGDMRKAMNRMNFGEDDLSSDDGEEGFVYSIDSESAGFEEDLDQSDVRRYGELYARFKARQKKEEDRYNVDLYNDELDDLEDDYSD